MNQFVRMAGRGFMDSPCRRIHFLCKNLSVYFYQLFSVVTGDTPPLMLFCRHNIINDDSPV